jgi:hypothetical protein
VDIVIVVDAKPSPVRNRPATRNGVTPVGQAAAREPDQRGVAVARGKTGDKAGTRVASEDAPREHRPGHPEDGEGREEGEPETPRRNPLEVCGGDDPEDEKGDRDGKDEFRKSVARRMVEELRPGDRRAKADQPEDGQHDFQEMLHHAPGEGLPTMPGARRTEALRRALRAARRVSRASTRWW